MLYFSDREQHNSIKTSMQISVTVWNGITVLVNKLIRNNNLAKDFPVQCPDGNGICKVDEQAFYRSAKAIIPNIFFLPNCGNIEVLSSTFFDQNPFEDESEHKEKLKQFTFDVLDFIEFVFKHISDVENAHYHESFNHYELKFLTTTTAREQFITDINEIFYRNNLAFKLTANGQIERIIDKELNNLIANNDSSDEAILDNLITEAIDKIKNPRFEERKFALERLWDAFERIKSFNNPNNKKNSANKLIQTASGDNQNIKDLLNTECKCLTDIGNKFQIRHYEMGKIPINDSDYIDYLFFRMYTIIQFFIKKQ